MPQISIVKKTDIQEARRVDAKNRNLDIGKVKELADGSTMLGQDAKENGLIDEIGSIGEAKDWLEKELKIKASVCVYE